MQLIKTIALKTSTGRLSILIHASNRFTHFFTNIFVSFFVNVRKFAPRCCVCKLPIMPEPGEDETVRVVALDRSFHVACYKCEVIFANQFILF